MRIEPRANLTITLLRRDAFGSDRFAGSVPRRVEPMPHATDTRRSATAICPSPTGDVRDTSRCDEVGKTSGPAGIAVPVTDENSSISAPTQSLDLATVPTATGPAAAYLPASATVGSLLDTMA